MVFFMENYNYYSKNIKKLEIIINTRVIVMLELYAIQKEFSD